MSYQHVLKAFNELYNSKQCLLLKSLRRFEVLVVLAFYLEQLVTKSEKNLLDRIQDRCDTMLTKLNWFGGTSTGSVSLLQRRGGSVLSANAFREIIKRLQSFGVIAVTVESSKLTDNVYGQLVFFLDEVTAAYEQHEIYKAFEQQISVHTTN